MTTNTLPQPMSRRDVWLTIALAVAREDLPEPKCLQLYEGHHGISIEVDSQAQGRMWAAVFGLKTDEPHRNPDGSRWICSWYATMGDCPSFPGWAVQIHAYPAHLDQAAYPSPLADQVVAAIVVEADVTEAEPESKIWACPENCGYHIADGPVPYGEPPTYELIQEHMEEHRYERERTAAVVGGA